MNKCLKNFQSASNKLSPEKKHKLRNHQSQLKSHYFSDNSSSVESNQINSLSISVFKLCEEGRLIHSITDFKVQEVKRSAQVYKLSPEDQQE